MMRLGMMVAIAGLASPVYAQNNALTRSEMQALRTQIQACWLVTGDVPSVTLGFSLDGKGRPVAASMKARGHAPAAKTAVEKAYALAKRAVLRCGRDGFNLPVEKYEQWRNIELTFDPERTILK